MPAKPYPYIWIQLGESDKVIKIIPSKESHFLNRIQTFIGTEGRYAYISVKRHNLEKGKKKLLDYLIRVRKAEIARMEKEIKRLEKQY